MSNDTEPSRFRSYESRLATQQRPIGPLQAFVYHLYIPERPPTFLEILFLPAGLIAWFGVLGLVKGELEEVMESDRNG